MKTVDIIISTPSILGAHFAVWCRNSVLTFDQGPHDPADYPNVKFVATAGELCPQGISPLRYRYFRLTKSG